MRYWRLFLVLFSIFSLFSHAQKTSLVFWGGGMMSNCKYFGSTKINSYYNQGVSFGLYQHVMSDDYVNLFGGFSFTQKGDIVDYPSWGYLQTTKRINYVQADILVGPTLIKNKKREYPILSLMVGLYFAGCTNANHYDVDFHYVGTKEKFILPYPTNNNPNYNKNHINMMDVGGKAGLSFRPFKWFSFYGFYDYGLLNVRRTSYDTKAEKAVKFKNRAFGINAAFHILLHN